MQSMVLSTNKCMVIYNPPTHIDHLISNAVFSLINVRWIVIICWALNWACGKEKSYF